MLTQRHRTQVRPAAIGLLATHLAGGELPAANGWPCRLVAPDRRGLDWIKWVTEIQVG